MRFGEPAAGEKILGVEITQNVQKTCFWGRKVRFSDFLEFLRKPPPLLRSKIFKEGGAFLTRIVLIPMVSGPPGARRGTQRQAYGMIALSDISDLKLSNRRH